MKGRIRPTRTGWTALAMALLTLFGALISGNNLLYLVYGLLAAAFAASWAALRATTRGLTAKAEFPQALRAGSPFALAVRVANAGRWTARALRVSRGPASDRLAPLAPGASAHAMLECVLPARGLHRLEGAALESAFPFDLLAWSAPVEAAGLALPRPLEGAAWEELESVCEASGLERPRRGAGDELYGARPYAEGDEPRLINWKLTLRAGRAFVNEYAEPAGAKVTVRVAPGSGPAAERRVAAAAAALERCAGSGAEFRVAVGPAGTPFGSGRGHLLLCLETLARAGDGAAARPVPARPGRPQPLPADHPWLPTLTRAGALLLFGGLVLVDEMEPGLLLCATPAFLLAGALETGLVAGLPGAPWDPLSALMMAYAVFFDWRWSGVVLANTHLLLYMIVNRLLAPLGPAELRQTFLIHFLAFFLISAQTISPWYFLFFLGFAAYGACWLALALARPPARGTPPAREEPVPARALAAPGAAALAAAAVLFAATPRIEPLRQANPFVALGLDKRQAASQSMVGFTENVALGFFGTLKKSTARVMRLKPLGGWPRPPAPDAPPVPALLVRGAAFDRFDGRRWSRSARDGSWRLEGRLVRSAERRGLRAWAARHGRMLVFPGAQPGGGPGVDVTLYPLNSAVVFTVRGLAALEHPTEAVSFDHTDSAFFGSPYLGGTSYRAWGNPDPGAGFGGAVDGRDAALDPVYLQASLGDPRVAALSRRLTAGAATPEEKVRRVREALVRGYRYTLYDDAARDLPDFLFSARSGNCEFFATAAAVLLRDAGVPTRLVAGFLADDWNEYGGFFDVRQGQAHAWVEAWDGRRWLTVDATPPSGFLSDRSGRAFSRLQRWLTAAQLRWYRDVIGYDSFVQRDVVRRARLALARDRLAALADAAWPAARALLVLAALAGLAWAARPLLRRRARTRFEAAERILSRAGFARRQDETALEFARAVAGARADLAPAVALAELHYRERFDPRGLDADARREGERLLVELARAARRAASV